MQPHIPTLEEELRIVFDEVHTTVLKAPSPVGNDEHRDPPWTFAENHKGTGQHTTGTTNPNAIWDLYNTEAEKADKNLVKEWKESLSSLLIFTGIFAAVLAAFIAESTKMLEQDSTGLLVTLAIFSINNAGNASNIPFEPPAFKPTPGAVWINCLFFASLGLTLLASLASIIALQWVADYESEVTKGGYSPEGRAKRRQFKYGGVEYWKMGEIIAFLPLLLHASVAVFWVGAIQWARTIHGTVALVVHVAVAVAAVFYVATTLLASIYATAPFRTPLSRATYWLFQWSINLVILISRLCAALVISAAIYLIISGLWMLVLFGMSLLSLCLYIPGIRRLSGPIPAFIQSHIDWLRLFEAIMTIAEISHKLKVRCIGVATKYVALWKSWFKTRIWCPVYKPISHWWNTCDRVWCWSFTDWTRFLYHLTVNPYPFIALWVAKPIEPYRRDNEAIEADPWLGPCALNWLANQLPRCEDTFDKLNTLVTTAASFPRASFSRRHARKVSWDAVLNSLSLHYMCKLINHNLDPEDPEIIGALVICSKVEWIQALISPYGLLEPDLLSPDYWTQFCFKRKEPLEYDKMSSEDMAYRLAREAPQPSLASPRELRMTVRIIEWRNLDGPKDITIWVSMFGRSEHYSVEYMKSCAQCFANVVRTFVCKPNIISGLFSSWSRILDGRTRRKRILEDLKGLDKCIEFNDSPQFHTDLIRLVCQDVELGEHALPSVLVDLQKGGQPHHTIQDPCLAIIAGYTCGIPICIGNSLTPTYVRRYRVSVATIQVLLLQPLVHTDLPEIWRLISTWFSDTSGVDMLYPDPMVADQMSLLRLTLEYPSQCRGHLPGVAHMLLHLFDASSFLTPPAAIDLRGDISIFGRFGLSGEKCHPVLSLFLHCDGSFDTLQLLHRRSLKEEWIQEVTKMCLDVKTHPASFVMLLHDLISDHTRHYLQPQSIAIFLELVEQAMWLADKARITDMLHPLAGRVENIRGKLVEGHWGDPARLQELALRADEVYYMLRTKAAESFVGSPSHIRVPTVLEQLHRHGQV